MYTIYVKDPAVFYAFVYDADFDKNDPTLATSRIQLPVIDVPDSDDEEELRAFVDEIGLKLEVFDVEFNKADVKITPYSGRSSNNGNILFRIEGLDKNEQTYYVRYTMNGRTPLKPYDDQECYKDPVHGESFKREGTIAFGMIGNSTAILYVSMYGDIDLIPLTLDFYPVTEPDKRVQRINVTKKMLKGNSYYFSKKDMKKLDPHELYNCYVFSGNKLITYTSGYFETKDNYSDYSPYWLSLKTGKHSQITIALDVDKRGGISNLPLYKLSKSAKSAKMNKLSKAGYTFKGWYIEYTDSKGEIKQKKVTTINKKFVTKYAPDKNLKLYARFKPNKYSVKYVISGKYENKKVKVHGKIKTVKYEYADNNGRINDIIIQGDGSQLTVKDERGLVLKGWTTVKKGAEVMYKTGQKVSLEELLPAKGKTIVLYAVYAPEDTAK